VNVHTVPTHRHKHSSTPTTQICECGCALLLWAVSGAGGAVSDKAVLRSNRERETHTHTRIRTAALDTALKEAMNTIEVFPREGAPVQSLFSIPSTSELTLPCKGRQACLLCQQAPSLSSYHHSNITSVLLALITLNSALCGWACGTRRRSA
jgi:hypothetical protein